MTERPLGERREQSPADFDTEAVKAAREAIGQILSLDECSFGAQARLIEAKRLARKAWEGLA